MADGVAGLQPLLVLSQGPGLSENTLPCGVQAQQTPSQPADGSTLPWTGREAGPVSQGTPSEAISRVENHLLASNRVLIIQMMDEPG